MAAAVAAGEMLRACDLDAEVVVFEKDDRVGRSILATGNGRCNFSNAHIDAEVYRNAAFAAQAFDALEEQCADAKRPAEALRAGLGVFAENPVHAFFADLGLVWREEGEGRLYPLANKASSVLDVLRAAVADAGAAEACDREVSRIDAPRQEGERYHLRFSDGAVEHADAVVVAVGGRVARALLPASLPFVETRPVLGPLRTDVSAIKQLNNTRVRCAVTLVGAGVGEASEAHASLETAAACRDFAGEGRGCAEAGEANVKAREEGELLFRDYGVSGIAVFNVSRFAEEGDVLLIDFLPQVDADEVEGLLHARRRLLAPSSGALSAGDLLRGMLLPAVAQAVLKEAGLRPEDAFGKRSVAALARALKAFPLEVRGVGDARQCQVHRGGFAVEAFDPCTFEARDVPRMHVAGEALDVDAPCGGYNLHWAWASGILAGRAAASDLFG